MWSLRENENLHFHLHLWFLQFSSNRKLENDSRSDSQSLTEWDSGWADPMANIVCEVRSAHKRATLMRESNNLGCSSNYWEILLLQVSVGSEQELGIWGPGVKCWMSCPSGLRKRYLKNWAYRPRYASTLRRKEYISADFVDEQIGLLFLCVWPISSPRACTPGCIIPRVYGTVVLFENECWYEYCLMHFRIPVQILENIF
jgi:hypothetical protein